MTKHIRNNDNYNRRVNLAVETRMRYCGHTHKEMIIGF